MSRSPLREIYRILAVIGALISLVIGVITACNATTIVIQLGAGIPSTLGIFLVTFVPFGLATLVLGILAEAVGSLTRIEEHLDRLVYDQERQTKVMADLVQTMSAGSSDIQHRPSPDAEPNISASPYLSKKHPIGIKPTEETLQIDESSTLKGRVKRERLVIRKAPTQNSPIVTESVRGDVFRLYGRSSGGTWVKVSNETNQWAKVDDLDIDGNVMDLPVLWVL
jgi:hypothetical protein